MNKLKDVFNAVIKIFTSEIWFFCRRIPKDKVLFPEMSCKEEVSTEEGRVLRNVAHGHVEVAALLHGGLHRRGFKYLVLMQFIVHKVSKCNLKLATKNLITS